MSFPTWKTNTGNSYVFPKTIIDGSIDVSGTFYNRAANVIIGNPDDNYSSTFGNINCSQVQTQTFKNEQISGTVNGFMISQTEILYLTTSGSFSDGVSKISGPGVTDICLNTIDTNTNIMTLYDNGTIPVPSKTENMYITDTNKLLFYNKEGIENDQGIQFTVGEVVTNDFVSEVSYNEIFLTNTNSLTSTSSTSITGYIQKNNNDYYLVTSDTITNNNFLDGYGISDISQNPCIMTTTTQTNQYKILRASVVINNVVEEPIKQPHSGFNYDNKFYLLDATGLVNNDFVEGTNVDLATTITLSGTHYYTYSSSVSDNVSFHTSNGFFDGTHLKIINQSVSIEVDDGIYNTTDSTYGFVATKVHDYQFTTTKNNFNNQTHTTDVAYINSNLQLVSLVDNTGKFTSENSITSIDSADIVPNVFNISSPNTITATSPQIVQYAYKYDANTLILENNSGIVGPFLFELPTLPAGSNQYGSYSDTFDKVNTVIHSNYVSPAITGSSAVIFTIGNDQVIYFGNSTGSGISKFIVNANLAPYTSVAFTSNLPFSLGISFNGYEITGKNGSLTDTTPLISNTRYVVVSIGGANKFIFGTTTQANLNDIIKGTTTQTGRYITSKVQSSSTSISGLYEYTLNYTQQPSTPFLSGLSWTQPKNSPIIVTSNDRLVTVGDFVNYDNGVWGYITNKNVVGSNMELTVGTFADATLSGTDLAIFKTDGVLSVYVPQSIDIYDPIRCDVYEEPIDIYDKKSFHFYKTVENNTYEPRTFQQYEKIACSVYTNSAYSATTKTSINFPPLTSTDTFVTENYPQTLTNKNFSGNVGIGTTNPTYTLDISAGTLGSNTNDEIRYARFKSNNYNVSYLDIYERRFNTGGSWDTAATRIQKMIDETPMGYIEFNPQGSDHGLAFGSNQTQLMTIKNNGNVGIGESTPDFKVHIRGNGPQLLLEGQTNENAKLRFSAGPNFTHGYHEIDTRFWVGGNAHLNYMYFRVNNGSEDNPSAKMTIRGDGRVGIGTTDPSFPLDIVGSESTNVTGRYFNENASLTYRTNTTHGIGIRTTGGVYSSTGSIISSDRRIKTNITEINDASSLDKIRLLKPSYYNYIDTTDRTSSVVEGFIAQEVKEVLPYAVLLQTSYIPNIFKVGSYNSLDNIITINDYDTNTLEYDASNNVFKKIILYDISDNKYECEINEIIASNQIKIQSSEDIPTDIFVYGQEVDNFNTLKKEAIFTVATAALQEVDRQQQADKLKIATLETQITDLLARLDALENP